MPLLRAGAGRVREDKDEYLPAFKKFKSVVKKGGNQKIDHVQSDTELHQSTKAQDFFDEEGLKFEPTSHI
jgi:hypothetical protein